MTHDGRTLRILTLIDEYTRECLALRVARRLNRLEVIDTLADVMLGRGIPGHIRSGVSGGYVDAFDTNGHLRLRLAMGSFSEPWGVALAPANFGAFSSMLLVGNTTSGMIAAYNPTTRTFQGFLQDSSGNAIVLPGLWGISFGNGNKKSGPTNFLYYAAGGGQYLTGVFGAITAN